MEIISQWTEPEIIGNNAAIKIVTAEVLETRDIPTLTKEIGRKRIWAEVKKVGGMMIGAGTIGFVTSSPGINPEGLAAVSVALIAARYAWKDGNRERRILDSQEELLQKINPPRAAS